VTSKPADHYSYTLYADPATAEQFDARRFGGPIGELVAETQARVLLELAGDVRGRPVLDVGTGTGRAALLLAKAGAIATGVDASEQMLSVARQRAAAAHLAVEFGPGDAHALPFLNRSYDVAVSLRVLMHTPDWRRCVAELCRVALSRVIVDYPSARSVAALESAARRLAHAAGRQTEPYRVLTDRAVREAFEAGGFRVAAVHRHFVLPIALHKAIGSRGFTDRAEAALRRLGLLRLVGSPVTILAERCAS
jgi:2-polyprenyl-3-methyl-5-hydroxy-6-metoxy-1,4-benzoquinol methylase